MLLMWSGGADSTFVLAELLAKKEPVRTISIAQPQFHHNREQFLARRRIVSHFKRKKITWPHLELGITFKYPFQHHGHIQAVDGMLPAMWLGLVCPYLLKDEDLAIAYIKGDNAIHWLAAIDTAFDGLQRISQKTGKLLLPAEWKSKAEILHGLKHHRLLRKTWWCEAPRKGRPCRRCSPCMTHKTAAWVLANHNDYKIHGDYGENGNGVQRGTMILTDTKLTDTKLETKA